MKPDESRMPPCNLIAEKSVLGGLMIEVDKVDDIAPLIRADDFHREPHRVVFTAMLAMRDAGKPINTIALADELDRLEKLDEIGGVLFLNKLMEAVPSNGNANIAYDAKLVREAAQRRSVIYAARDLEAAAYAHADVDELLTMLDRTQRQVSEREEARGCLSMFDVLHKRRESLKQNDRGQVPTGWPDLDDKLGGGMRAGSLVIVGARPSVGKTSAALGMVLSAAQEGLPAVFVSLEQSQIEIANRLLCATTSLPFADIELDRLTDPLDRDRLEDAENQLANLPLKIIDEGSARLSQILASARAERRRGLRLLIVDYLQLLRPDDDRVHREQHHVSRPEATRARTRLRRRLPCPTES